MQHEMVTDKLTETFFGRVERSMVARELEYRIRVENLKDEVVDLELLDSIPVSTTDRIQIKGIEFTPDPTVTDLQNREGVMKWEVMQAQIVKGNIVEADTEVIVNAWNRNIIPWWLLLPQGVSGAIKEKAGFQPFKELAQAGPIPLGRAVLTSAGKLNYRGIIHVAGINMLWRASERSIRDSVKNTMDIVTQKGFASVAFPIIGAGSGGYRRKAALEIMQSEFSKIASNAKAVVIEFE